LGQTVFGSGAYAYYADLVPAAFRGSPLVVFEPVREQGAVIIKDIYIRPDPVNPVRFPGRRFFMRPSDPLRGLIVAIDILGFINCPGFPEPTITLEFV
jgi:hypothetical protein